MPRNKCYVLLFIGSIIMIYSCSSVSELSGDYSSSRTPYSFNMSKDSFFVYKYKFGFAYQYSQGIWSEIGKNEIVLNSRFKNRTRDCKLNCVKG